MWVNIISTFVYLRHNFRLVDKREGTRELAQCLSDVRVGRVTQDALHVLNCRVAVSEKAIENKTAGRGCLWLASRNKDVALRNEMCFKSLVRDDNQEFFRFFSTHHQEQPDGVELSTDELHIRECKLRGKISTDLLQPILDIAIGSRVRVVRNRASVLGIFNGALGTVVDFCFVGKIPTARVQPKTYGGEQPLAIILVQMDDVDIGCVGEAPRVVAFAPFLDEETALHIEGGRKFYRKQFPLECAHASTIHKAQGITLSNKDAAVVIDDKAIFMGGTYVAISRVTELESLHLTRAVTSKHFTSHEWMRRQVAAEYERLQAFHILVDEDDNFTCESLIRPCRRERQSSIRSLKLQKSEQSEKGDNQEGSVSWSLHNDMSSQNSIAERLQSSEACSVDDAENQVGEIREQHIVQASKFNSLQGTTPLTASSDDSEDLDNHHCQVNGCSNASYFWCSITKKKHMFRTCGVKAQRYEQHERHIV
jgi:hypothetical protein